MVVAGGDYVHFVVEYGGKIEKCRVTETALLNRERMSRKDAGYAQLVAIFVRHRAEIEHLALAKLQREGQRRQCNQLWSNAVPIGTRPSPAPRQFAA